MHLSEALDQLAISTLNSGLSVVSVGDVLWPVAVVSTEDDFDMRQFSDDDPEACREAAREFVREYGASVREWAVCYDGHVEIETQSADGSLAVESHDAVIVEFGERGSATSCSLATPYRGVDAPGGFAITGDSVVVEEDEQLLG